MKKLLLSSILICFALIGNVIAQSVANQTVLPASYRMAMGYDSEVYENEQYIVLEDGSIGVYGALYKNDGVDITEITLPGSLRMAQDHDMGVYGSELYTVLEDGFSGIRGALHKYDGTTFTQINLPGSLTMARDYDMEVYNNDLYLVLEDGSSGIYGALYKYDGTSFTQIVLPGSLRMAEGYNMIMYDNDLYVVLEDGFSGIWGALHKYDGTTFTQINLPGSLEMARDYEQEVYNNDLYLVLEDGSSGIYGALYKYDGTSFTQIVLPGSLRMAEGDNMIMYDNDLYVVLEDGFSGIWGALHKYDGTSLTQINLPGSLEMARDYDMEVFNCKLYFVLEGGSSGVYGALYELDNVLPSVITQNITVKLDASGEAIITADQIDNGSSDNCVIDNLALDVSQFNCSNIGENTVTLTVTDASGNQASETAVVTVTDTTAPTVVTQDITVELDASGEAIITADQIDNGSADNCGIASLDLSRTNFNGFDIGQNTVELKVIDSSGNQSTGTATVTIVDTAPPNAVCSNQTIFLDESGNASISASDVDGGSSDNASAAYVPILNYEPVYSGGMGANDFQFIAQVITMPQTISNFKIELELGTCKSNGLTGATLEIVELDSSGQPNLDLVLGSSSVPESEIYGSPGCDGAGFGITTFDFSGVDLQQDSQYALVLKATEGTSGSSVSWNRSAIPTDPSNPYQGGNAWTYDMGYFFPGEEEWMEDETHDLHFSIEAMDEGLTYSIDQDSFDCNNVGVNDVILTVTDVSGNTSSCTSEITVIDNLDPTVLTQNITVELDENGEATITADQIDNGSTDNCSSISGDCIDGMTYGNAEIFIEGAGMGRVDFSSGRVSASSGGVPMELVPITTIDSKVRSGDLVHARSTLSTGSRPSGESIFYRTTDDSITWGGYSPSGTYSNRTRLIIEQENVAAGELIDFSKPYNLRFELNDRYLSQAGGFFTSVSSPADISAVLISGDLGTTNTCLLTTSLDVTSFDCSNLGENTVTLTATDASGNQATATALVTVTDTAVPAAVTQNLSVELDEFGAASITAAQVDNGSSDNCGIDNLSLDVTSFNCSNLGENTVTLTATDGSGKQVTATAVITVIDAMAPALVTADITVSLDDNATVSIEAGDLVDTLEDNCSLAGEITLALDQDTFTATGVYVVNITATDASGNTTTESAEVTVDSTLSIEQVDSDIQVKLFPNPTTDHLFFEVSNTELMHITIYDMKGKLVKTSQESHSVDVTNLSSGVYFAKVDAKGGNTSKILRFIKK